MGVIDELTGQRVYLDANVFICGVEGIAPYVEPMRKLFAAVDAGSASAATSELTLAEVLVRPMADGNASLQATYEDMLQSGSGFQVIPVARAILIEAARLRVESNALRLPDAIHIATARACGCSVFLTNDRSLSSAPGLRVLLCSDMVGA
jgi:predicted nucleic acid-binding protein